MQKKLVRALCAALAAGMCLSGACAEPVSSERVLEIERTLYDLGYHAESFDALMDEVTRKAVRSFQVANGLPATGELDDATLQLLDSGEGVTCHDYLVMLRAEYADIPILQAESVGDAVLSMQQRLKALGYFSGKCEGVFGGATMAAVRRFQMANGLSETGVADRSTQFRLNEGTPLSWQSFLESSVAVFGDEGLHVRQLQRKLQELGYFTGDCTGRYGELTQRAVSRFQEANQLETTGLADIGTCTALYTGEGLPMKDPEALRVGEDRERVIELQNQLAAHGYFDRNITGVFGATTQIAVRLFQMANGLSVSGEVDAATLSLLQSGQAASLDSVRQQFSEQLRTESDSVRTVVGSVAQQLRGRAFAPDDEDLYRGFAFVQYVCLAAGIPVVTPEELMALTVEPVEDYAALLSGDILAIAREDGSTLLAIASGNSSAVYATQESVYVLEAGLHSLDGGQIFRWNMKAVEE